MSTKFFLGLCMIAFRMNLEFEFVSVLWFWIFEEILYTLHHRLIWKADLSDTSVYV